MKWLPLKIYQADLLVQEIETVESKYDNMINQVKCAPSTDEKTKNDFLSFREEIEQRIIELDEFYNLNINDSRVGAFEKIRNRLATLLEINIEGGNEITRKTYTNEKVNVVKKESYMNLGITKKSNIQTKSKLMMSSANMRQSKVRQSSSSKMFGE